MSEPRPTSSGSGALPDATARLATTIEEEIRAWETDPAPWTESEFAELALEAFRVQYRHVELYRRYCRARGATPETVEDWREVPPVPTAAFREVALAAGPAEDALVFRTSGTTRGPERRGRHLVQAPSLYRASAEAAFLQFVLGSSGYPEAVRPERSALEPPVAILSLVPPNREDGGSSLSWMCEAIIQRFGAPGSRWAAGTGGIDWAAAEAWARSAAGDDEPVVVLTTTLGLDEWTRRLQAGGSELRLPEGSRLMDTGGAKGREGLDRADVLGRTSETLGLAPDHVVNELGMTELLSQRYGSRVDGRLYGPPWLRTRALDPETLERLPEGRTGALGHLDLANVASVSAVLTEDLGDVVDGGVAFLGRAGGAPSRGCSLATAELLAADGAEAGGGAGPGTSGGMHGA